MEELERNKWRVGRKYTIKTSGHQVTVLEVYKKNNEIWVRYKYDVYPFTDSRLALSSFVFLTFPVNVI